MFKSKKQEHTYGIIGLGRFGHALALELAQSGADIMVMDRDEEKVREMRDYTENAYVVKSLDKKSLMEVGIQQCDVAVVCIGSHLETSILTTLNLVSLGVSTVIAKATSAEHGEILEKLGAQVVYPERDMGIRLARRLESARALDYIQLSEKLNISKLMVPESMVNTTVIDLQPRKEYGINIIAVENAGTVMESIGPNYVFQKGDILYVSGTKANLDRFADALAE
ncbi:MAG: TrkA family potassium uptake protein [Clostridia bacterium]|nr:TrkA family potassium uptake protein [Clostridia bacterium]